MTAQESKLANAYESTIVSALTADSSSVIISVDAAPTDSTNTAITGSVVMYLVLDPDSDSSREYVKVTNISGTTLTVVRNIDTGGGGLRTHAAGAKIRQVPQAQHFDDIHDRINTIINEDGTAVVTTGVVKDEDNMSSNSATHLATQQSIKAYVDSQIQTEESIEDFVGGMVTGNTETFIDVTYEDSDGTMDFVVPVKDEDDMSSDSATHLATQQSIKKYVDDKVTAQDLDFQGDSGGALNIDLDSESLTIAGGTGIDTAGSGNQVQINIDSTVVTESSTDTLTNKSIDADNNTLSNIEVDNLKSGVLDTDLSSVSGSDDTLPSAKATKAYVDNVAQTTEEVQDIVGAMFSGNTETRVTVTYDDSDGTIDVVVDDMTADTQLTDEQVQDIVGAMVSGNTETNISVTYDDTANKLNFVSTDTNTQLTTEEVQDIVGNMLSGNTETRIAVTYDDTDGTIDFVVDDMTADTQLTQEQVQDIVGAMFTGNTETRISATYEDGDGTIDLVVDDMTANTQLTTEEVQDIVGAMFTGNTETNITVTYEDSDGTIDLVATGNTTEQIQDIVGAMFTSNTETGITATYEDSDGTIDLVVSADSALIKDADNDTKIQVEESSDEDKIRYDVAGTEVAVQDAGGVALTTNGGIFRHHQTQAATYTVATNEGAVMAGPITITGTVTNNGTMVVI